MDRRRTRPETGRGDWLLLTVGLALSFGLAGCPSTKDPACSGHAYCQALLGPNGYCHPETHTCACDPDCALRDCGDDGCRGSCGTCEAPDTCDGLGQCVCYPDCTDRQCGDDGCGGSCGTCPGCDQEPDASLCVEGACTEACCPDCGTRECGPDPVCGVSCGTCPPDIPCAYGRCTLDTPCCEDRECGPDPCGVAPSCGTCPYYLICDAGGQCVYGDPPCCDGRDCGPDPCFGVSCGTCQPGWYCDVMGHCQEGGTPCCGTRECGPDPCVGLPCGTCTAGEYCDENGTCQTGTCTPDCEWKDCGPDGCGGTCGTCETGTMCVASGRCECAPDCTNQECGPDPHCGTSCGICPSGQFCTEALQCEISWDTPCCGDRECGPDPCIFMSCGTCPAETMCSAAGHCLPTNRQPGEPCIYGSVNELTGICLLGLTCTGSLPQPVEPACVTDADCSSMVPYAGLWNPDCVGGRCGYSFCAAPCDDGACDCNFEPQTIGGDCLCAPAPPDVRGPGTPCPFGAINTEGCAMDCEAGLTCIGANERPDYYPCATDADCAAFFPERWNYDCEDGGCGMSMCVETCVSGTCIPGYGPFEHPSGYCFCLPEAQDTPRQVGEPCTWGMTNALEGLCADGLRCLGESLDAEARPCPGGVADCVAFYPDSWHPDCELGGCGYSVCVAACTGGACEPDFTPIDVSGECFCRPDA